MKKIILIIMGLIAGLAMSLSGSFEWFDSSVSLSTLFLAGMTLLEQRKEAKLSSEAVFVSLETEEGVTLLPLELVRRDFSRAELLGRIGMIPMRETGKRFSLKNLLTPATMREINQVSCGESDHLVISATQEEVDQFDLL